MGWDENNQKVFKETWQLGMSVAMSISKKETNMKINKNNLISGALAATVPFICIAFIISIANLVTNITKIEKFSVYNEVIYTCSDKVYSTDVIAYIENDSLLITNWVELGELYAYNLNNAVINKKLEYQGFLTYRTLSENIAINYERKIIIIKQLDGCSYVFRNGESDGHVRSPIRKREPRKEAKSGSDLYSLITKDPVGSVLENE